MYFDDIQPNTITMLAPVTMDKEKMMEFGRQYDPLLLHTDETYAKTTHFGDLIAPGVMTFMSVWSQYLAVCPFLENFLAGKSTSMEWHGPVYAGDVLTGRAEITKLTKRSAKNGIVEVTVQIFNQKEELVLTDVTEVIVKCRPIK